MSNLATHKGWTAAGTAEAVSLPRRHLLLIAILMCIPLPVLSLAATVVPLPQMFERAAATFATLAAPALGGNGPVIRERTVAVGSVEIQYESSEQPPGTGAQSLLGDGQPRRGAPTRKALASAKARTGARGLRAVPADPASEAGDGPVDADTTGSGKGRTGSRDVGTPVAEPGDRAPDSARKPEPPSPTNPAPNPGGGSGGSGVPGGSPGTGGSGGSESGSQKPPPGGGARSDPGGGATPPGAGNGDHGGGSGTPPEPPPGSGREGGRP